MNEFPEMNWSRASVKRLMLSEENWYDWICRRHVRQWWTWHDWVGLQTTCPAVVDMIWLGLQTTSPAVVDMIWLGLQTTCPAVVDMTGLQTTSPAVVDMTWLGLHTTCPAVVDMTGSADNKSGSGRHDMTGSADDKSGSGRHDMTGSAYDMSGSGRHDWSADDKSGSGRHDCMLWQERSARKMLQERTELCARSREKQASQSSVHIIHSDLKLVLQKRKSAGSDWGQQEKTSCLFGSSQISPSAMLSHVVNETECSWYRLSNHFTVVAQTVSWALGFIHMVKWREIVHCCSTGQSAKWPPLRHGWNPKETTPSQPASA